MPHVYKNHNSGSHILPLQSTNNLFSLSLYTVPKVNLYAVNTCACQTAFGGVQVEVELHSFLSSELGGGQSASRPDCSAPRGERPPTLTEQESVQTPTPAWRTKKRLALSNIAEPAAQSLYRLRYPGSQTKTLYLQDLRLQMCKPYLLLANVQATCPSNHTLGDRRRFTGCCLATHKHELP